MKGDNADEIFFLIQGRVSFYFGKHRRIYRTITAGGYFGDVDTLLEQARSVNVFAMEESHVLVMNSSLIKVIREDFPYI